MEKVVQSPRLITCIMPKGVPANIAKWLWSDHGITAVTITHARGSGMITPEAHRSSWEDDEKEILKVIVEPESAEKIFTAIYTKAEIDRPHGGIIFMTPLALGTEYTLPDLPMEQ